MKQLAQKLQHFMVGRYGNDEFSLFLSVIGLILTFLANFKYLGFLYFIGIILIFFSLFRVLSKNYNARRKELNWYLLWSAKPKAELKVLGNKIRDRKTHRYFKCKNCKTVMRVPKGRGKIEITCPKCRAKVIKKT
ncbi:MAG: hypothetical protein IKV25_01740 [Clostridia bacterium]|nr:hypothetical protein [Clostridia bacterium]